MSHEHDGHCCEAAVHEHHLVHDHHAITQLGDLCCRGLCHHEEHLGLHFQEMMDEQHHFEEFVLPNDAEHDKSKKKKKKKASYNQAGHFIIEALGI